jgi:integrase
MAIIRKLRGRWQAQVRRRWPQPRAKSFDSKAEAERWARQLETELDRTGALPDLRLAESTTLGAVLKRYINEASPTKRGGQVEIVRLRALAKQPIAHRTMATLSARDLASYRDERLTTVATSTVLKELNIMSHAIDTANREWGIHTPANPCKLVRRPSPPKGRSRRLQGAEEQRLLAGTAGGRNPHLHDLIIIAIETGMRRGELLGLDWRHVDMGAGVATLPLTRNGESREVPLSSRARNLLQTCWEAQGRPSAGRVLPTTQSALVQAWGHLCRRVGIANLRFHDLRHEAVSRLFEKGLNVVEVGTISGHKELRVLQRYTHLRASDLVARLG